jgi:antitoxin component YwqK of YwqJK toxin-antitoxin module
MYENGKLSGKRKWYRENGKLMQIGEFKDEKRVGLWKRYHPNKALYDEGEFMDDKKTGEWKIYDANGALMKTKEFKKRLPQVISYERQGSPQSFQFEN